MSDLCPQTFGVEALDFDKVGLYDLQLGLDVAELEAKLGRAVFVEKIAVMAGGDVLESVNVGLELVGEEMDEEAKFGHLNIGRWQVNF